MARSRGRKTIVFWTSAGGVWRRRGGASFAPARKDGAEFAGLDPPPGPLYLSTGYDQAGMAN